MNGRYSCFVVTYGNTGEQLGVILFNNEDAALSCFSHYVGEYDHVDYKEMPIYGSYKVYAEE